TLVLVPVVRRLAVRIGAVVKPDERRVHSRPTPTLGGIGMLVGFLVGMLVAWRLDAFGSVFDNNTEPLGLAIAAAVILAVGVIDDLREVSAPAKASGIVLAASVLVFSGISILSLRIPFVSTFVLDPNWSYLLSVLWVLGMCNAINFIDGLDGLAAGIVAIAAATFFLYSQQLVHEGALPGSNIGPLVSILVLGMCIGFLPYNIHPARIFMGDGGALLLGLLMAASTMVVGGRTDTPVSGQTFFFFAPVFIPLVILGIPILDTAFAIVRRARTRTSPATADKDHLHHRLMRLGHGHRRSVFILWGWTALLCAFVLYPTYTHKGDGIVPIGIAALGLALYTLLHPGLRQERRSTAPVADLTDRPTSDPAAADGEPPAAEVAKGQDSVSS
ncbi:MAG TPA: MraY family glycosyltransferase, partial [Acidimicrobiales bacterium]|nr:MraY family glycosyltransferase [Acidimicrobiales bacterium]